MGAGGIPMGAPGFGSGGGIAGMPIELHTGGIVGVHGRPHGYVHPASFDYAPRFDAGLNKRGYGLNEVPVIAHRGEVIGWPQQMQQAFGGGDTHIHYNPTIDARGADAQAVARLAAVMAQDRKDFEKNVKSIVGKWRGNTPSAF